MRGLGAHSWPSATDLTTLEDGHTGKAGDCRARRPINRSSILRRSRVETCEPREGRERRAGRRETRRWPPQFPTGQSTAVSSTTCAHRRTRGGRNRHGDRPRRLPVRALREVYGEIVQREGGVRRRAPEGDSRDRRAQAPTTTCAARAFCDRGRQRTSSRRRPERSAGAATPRSRSCMLEAIRDVYEETGPARRLQGGGRDPTTRSRRCSTWCSCTGHTSGPDWLTARRLHRLGASSLR